MTCSPSCGLPGCRAPSPEVLERIAGAQAVRPSVRVEQHREAIRALAAQHHAHDPRVFGSVARGDDLLEVQIDVVPADTLKGPMRERVLSEAIAV